MPKKLEPGEHSIDREDVEWKKLDNGSWQFWWTVRLHDGRTKRLPSQGPTKGMARSRARARVAELLATGTGSWKTSAKLTDYVNQVTRPAIEAAQIAERSKDQYRRGVNMLMGDCQGHKHSQALAGYSIATGTKFRALEGCLREIAQLHGHESAHQARSVLSKYLMQQLLRDELITGDPIRGMSLDLGAKPTQRSRGGKALTAAQRQEVIDHLLELDPEEGVKKRVQGRWSYADRVARRRAAIDLTLLQACTGVRVSEANALEVDRHLSEDDGHLVVEVTADIAKNSMARRVPLLLDKDHQVAQRLRERRDAAPAGGYLIGAPTDQAQIWEAGNCTKTTGVLYTEMAEILKIEAFQKERTHIWRTTLNSLLEGKVSAERRSSLFGHTAEVNAQHYTDLRDISQLTSVG